MCLLSRQNLGKMNQLFNWVVQPLVAVFVDIPFKKTHTYFVLVILF